MSENVISQSTRPSANPSTISTKKNWRNEATPGKTCYICHKSPSHSRTYYGIVFCTECFHKYIWTPTRVQREFSGEIPVKNIPSTLKKSNSLEKEDLEK